MSFAVLRRRALIASAGIATAVVLPLAGPVLTPATAATTTTTTVAPRAAVAKTAAPKALTAKQKKAAKAKALKAKALKRGKLIVKVAARYKGRPYRYGANGPKAFDCSGYTRYIVKKAAKIKLPRTAAQQSKAKKIKKVAKSKRMIGDLIFFRSGGTVSHVAIYAGNGTMWDAPHSGSKVQKRKIYTSKVTYGRLK